MSLKIPTNFLPPPDLTREQRGMVQAFMEAYQHGAFPMADPAPGTASNRARRIDWFIPDPRAILPLQTGGAFGGLHISGSLRRLLRPGRFKVSSDVAFEQVIRECGHPRPGREETWLDDRLVSAYTLLHRCGLAHSVEVWAQGDDSGPVGGIYGVQMDSAFCAESMFCAPERGGSNASKVAMAALVHHLIGRGFRLLDVQIANPHTLRMGVSEISATEYQALLKKALETPASWGAFRPPWEIVKP